MTTSYPPLDIVQHWADANEHLIALADAVPAGKWNWSPEPRMWNFRGIFLHIIGARYYTTKDEDIPNFWQVGQTTDGVKQCLRDSWRTLAQFLANSDALAAPDPRLGGDPSPFFEGPDYADPPSPDGHYVAWHRMVHDIHHRADILHYLDIMQVDLSAIPRRRPL